MDKNPLILDADESAFFEAELKYVQARVFEVEHKTLKALTILSVNNDAPSGSETVAYRKFDAVGVAKIVADYATDFPRVDVYGKEESAKVRGIGDSYGYSIKEIRRAQMTGLRLEQRRAAAARRAIEEKLDSVAWKGDSEYGLQGLINFPGITEYTLANGAGGFKTWASKTAAERVKDVAGLLTSVVELTNGRAFCDTLIMPVAQYNLLAYTPMGPEGSKTILTFIRENFPTLTLIDWVSELKGAGAGGTDRIMAFNRSPDKVDFQMPQLFEQFPADKRGLEYVVICHAETAGTIVYFPQEVAFADGL